MPPHRRETVITEQRSYLTSPLDDADATLGLASASLRFPAPGTRPSRDPGFASAVDRISCLEFDVAVARSPLSESPPGLTPHLDHSAHRSVEAVTYPRWPISSLA